MSKKQISIPSGWDFLPISNLGKVIGGGTPDTNNDDYWKGEILWATPTDITQLNGKYITNTQRKISKLGLQKSSAKLLPINSLLMTSRATIGYCAINLKEICTNQGFQNIIPNEKIDIEFLYYMIQSYEVQDKLTRNAYGSTFLEIPNKSVKKIKILVPPIKEQSLIASFFSKVDELIYISQHLIEKLQFLKKGLMQRLFTEGIEHTEFKETRLGNIPNNWDLIRGKYIYKIMSGISTSNINFEIDDILYLKVSDMNNPINRIYIIDSAIKCSVDNSQHKNIIPINSVIFPKRGAAIFTNKVGILNQKAILDPNLMALIPKKDKVYYKFLYYYLKYYHLSKICENAGVPQLNNKDLYPLSIKIPPLKEQERISSILGNIDKKIGNQLYYQIRLKKIKKGLMQDLLTGKKRIKIN